MGRSVFPLLPPYHARDSRDENHQYIPSDGITPYMGLRARLSQTWVNRWTILLLLVLVRVLLAAQSLQSEMASAKIQALSACSSVEATGSAIASMPHYLSQGVNDLTASGVTKAVNGLVDMLQLTVSGVEGMVVYYINFVTQTYICLITMAVKGSVEAGVSLMEDVTGFLNTTLPSIGSDISKGAQDFETALNDFLSTINGAASLLGGSGHTVPTLNLDQFIGELDNLTLPSSINEELQKINASVPTFDQVKNFTTSAIEFPFEQLKHLINSSLGGYQFDQSVFPIPERETLSFCSNNDGISNFFNDVEDAVLLGRKIFIVVLSILAILACVPMAYREMRQWRTMKERSQLVRKEAHDPMDVVYIISRPYTAAAGIKAASYFNNGRRQILTRWAIAYATSVPALFVLSLGIAALFSCLCQYILLQSLEKEVPTLTAEVSGFADQVMAALNNASEKWANGANQVISSTNDDINQNMLGWVNISASALNGTLNTFLNETTKLLNDTFGDTPFYGAVTGLFDCLIELKIQGIQKGITWVADNAHVDFPELPNNVFSIGAATSLNNSSDPSDSFLANPGGTTGDAITDTVVSIADRLHDGLVTETYISLCLVLIWVVIAMIGTLRSLILCCKKERVRGEGGERTMAMRGAGGMPIVESNTFEHVPVPLNNTNYAEGNGIELGGAAGPVLSGGAADHNFSHHHHHHQQQQQQQQQYYGHPKNNINNESTIPTGTDSLQDEKAALANHYNGITDDVAYSYNR
jgi:hypothetical protein